MKISLHIWGLGCRHNWMYGHLIPSPNTLISPNLESLLFCPKEDIGDIANVLNNYDLHNAGMNGTCT